MKIKNLIIIFAVVFIFMGLPINLVYSTNEKNQIVVGLDTNVPPMGFLDSNGEIVGFDIDLARETFKTIGKEVAFQPIDWDAKELELETGKIDVIWNSLSKTPEREKNMLLTKPYMKNRQIVIVRADSKCETLDDLSGKTFAVQKGSTGATSLKSSTTGQNAKNIVELENMVNCLNEVKLKKSDAAVVDEVIAKYYLREKNMGSDFKILKQEISTEDYVIAVKKENIELKEQIEKGLFQVNDSGKASEISKKWFGEAILCFDDSQAQPGETEVTNKNDLTMKPLFNGLLETLKLFFVCLIFSLPLGFLICFIRQLKFKSLRILIDLYIRLMQGTPLLLQLFFVFYGLPYISPCLAIKDRFLAGLIAFILNYSAYFAEIFRGGFKSIDKEQFEAIQVLRIPRLKATFRIILPQVLKVCLPSICNETVTLVKDTALIFSVGIIELLSVAKNIVNSTANISAYVVTAGIYLVVCFSVSMVFKNLEKKFKFE